MNTMTNKLAALVILSGFAFAGGDIAPIVEPEVQIPETIIEEEPISNNSFYLGLGYTYMNMSNTTLEANTIGHGMTGVVGYKFLDYLAVEGRYSTTVTDVDDNGVDKEWTMSNMSIFLKPQYTFDPVTIYGLVGYGQFTLAHDNDADVSVAGLQWGAGASVSIIDNLDIFVDYTRLHDDVGIDTYIPTNDMIVGTINVGLNYNF